MMVVLGGAQMTYAAAKTSVTDSKPYAVYVELSTPKYGFFKPEKVRYEVVLNGNIREAYVDTALMTELSECMPSMNAYEMDFSESGVEKYTFPTWGHTYMGLQRVKYSHSGTAAAMKTNRKWAR